MCIRPIFCIGLFLLLYNNKSQAQNADETRAGKEIVLSTGFNNITIRDAFFSRQPFSGNLPVVRAKFARHGRLFSEEFMLSYSRGDLVNKINANSKASCFFYEASISGLYNFSKSDDTKWKLQGGLGTHLLYNYRSYNSFINNARSFDLSLPVTVLCSIERRCDPGSTGIHFKNMLSVSPFAFVSLPSYSTENPQGLINGATGTKEIFNAASFQSLPDYFFISNILTGSKALSRKSALGLQYKWLYQNINAARELRIATHQLLLSYIYSFY